MSYQITLTIAEDSEIGRLIESVAAREQLNREEAALKLSQSAEEPRGANADAYKIIGAFSSLKDVKIMDEAMQLIMEERHRRNGGAHSPVDEAEQKAEEKRLAAIERFYGCLKDYPDLWQHFEDEHYEDIERENARDLI